MSIPKNILSYTMPKLHIGKDWYIDFYAYNPATASMRRKKIKLNRIESVTQRRKYASDLILRLTINLSNGWNPWIEKEIGENYLTFNEVTDKYRTYIQKMHRDDRYRKETIKSYTSYLKNIEDYNASRPIPITYMYQMDKNWCVDLLDEVYITRDNTAFTRDNYLGWMRTFISFCLSHNYIKESPLVGISTLGIRGKKKIRDIIPSDKLKLITTYLHEKNKYYLFASYLLYYCFIRPAEMARLKIGNINVSKQTLYLEDTITKNRKNGVITLPQKVIKLMIELNIFSYPSSYYIFSNAFMPGIEKKSEKTFRDWWSRHVRKDLKLHNKYKFYSLKDTGITNMLRHYDVLSVRDQARHSSILMTDIYTPHDIQEANQLITSYDDVF